MKFDSASSRGIRSLMTQQLSMIQTVLREKDFKNECYWNILRNIATHCARHQIVTF